MVRLEKRLQLPPQPVNLPIFEDSHAREVPVFVVEGNLLGGKPEPLPLEVRLRDFQEAADRMMLVR
jgi:hypothetical protein